MRKLLLLFMSFILIVSGLFPGFVAAESVPEISSGHAILAEASSGRVFYEKAADEKAFPASTTKIMTALLAIEALDPAASLTATESAIQIDRDGSNMGILNGEVLTVEQLLYGVLVHSANDAANVLAEAVSGSIENFVALMNQRAAELGMTGTHFSNAHGYHDPEHYTTARDLLTVAVTAMKNDLFRKIVATPTYEIPPTNKYTEVRYLSTSNALINPMRGHRYLYEGAKGIKNGYTDVAGACLVSYAERKGKAFICVTMEAPVNEEGTHSFIDTYRLLNYGFNEFTLKTVADVSEIVTTHEIKWAKGGDYALLSVNAPVELLLPKNYDKEKLTREIYTEEKTHAPVKKGEILGRVEYFYDGASLGSADLVVTEDVKRSFFKMTLGSLIDFIFSAWVMTPLAIIVVILLLRSAREEKKKKRERAKRREQARRDFYKP